MQRPDRPFPFFVIFHLAEEVVRRSAESTQYSSEDFRRQLRALGVTCSMSRAGEVWDNWAMDSFLLHAQDERMNRKHYATPDAACADVFDYIERFYNPIRRHSALGTRSPVAFGQSAAVAQLTAHGIQDSSQSISVSLCRCLQRCSGVGIPRRLQGGPQSAV